MEDIFQTLTKLGIEFKKYQHPPVYTVEEASEHAGHIPGGRSKNLFLRNKKGDKYYLIIADTSTNTDLKSIASIVDEKRIGFASPERLKEHLGITPGAVSPFGLLNDKNKIVTVLLDKKLTTHDELGFHPNINTETLVISSRDLIKYLNSVGNKLLYF